MVDLKFEPRNDLKTNKFQFSKINYARMVIDFNDFNSKARTTAWGIFFETLLMKIGLVIKTLEPAQILPNFFLL